MAGTGEALGRSDESTTPSAMKSTLLVVGAGMIGGLVFWVLTRITGILPFDWLWYASVPTALLLGGVSSFLGVFLLANSDTSKTTELKHTLAFALICGVVWSPVIDAAKQVVLGAVAANKADTAKTDASQLNATVSTGSTAAVENQVAKTQQTTLDAVKTLPTVTNAGVRQKVLSDSQDALSALVDASSKAPEASVNAIATIGNEAASSGDPTVARKTLDALTRLQKRSPEAAVKAESARQEILKRLAVPK